MDLPRPTAELPRPHAPERSASYPHGYTRDCWERRDGRVQGADGQVEECVVEEVHGWWWWERGGAGDDWGEYGGGEGGTGKVGVVFGGMGEEGVDRAEWGCSAGGMSCTAQL